VINGERLLVFASIDLLLGLKAKIKANFLDISKNCQVLR